MATEQITNWLPDSRKRLWAAWMSLQVEFQGRYSVGRIQRLHCYMRSLDYRRMTAVCLLTPLPCLLSAVLIELAPLADPKDGVYANGLFFIRIWGVTCWMVGSLTLQMGQMAPRHQMTLRHAAIMGVLAGFTTSLTSFGIAVVFVFPVPFGMLIASPPCVAMLIACYVYFWGSRWRNDPLLRIEVKQQMLVLGCQLSLTFVYPIFIYGFISLTGFYQALFVLLLPIIKILAKNWISRALGKRNDAKPEEVIFNVEIFNALYAANALQNASTWGVTVIIMLVDLMNFWVSMLDVVNTLNEVKTLMDKIPRDHPAVHQNFVELAASLLDVETNLINSNHPATSRRLTRLESWVSRGKKITEAVAVERQAVVVLTYRNGLPNKFQNQLRRVSQKIVPMISPRIHGSIQLEKPIGPPAELVEGKAPAILETIFSRKDRAHFIHKTARLLFILEYLVLIEYVEVVLPIVYSKPV
ncbi:unnamed protein product [Phytophthora fragariaefolia]|uniref:Unnamed protein product n=1 Tax=Phytophthora fragariaefolia TaxID=1490495 RepID=A0A9W6Y7Q8_9STRA|nr:unnamed protein product [Phytophthora fragariaefolia]